jgi:vacuolar protein sorting-associated protein VTA1
MALRIPPELKKITQYIRRAEELSKQSNPTPETILVAYHCRQHAVQMGIPLATTADAKKCLGDILTTLEEHRSKMGGFSKEEKYTICQDFAYKIFDKADAEDRAGKSSKGTARTFYAAASFLDILKQFQNEEEQEGAEALEEQKKSFYAKWKATDILKAIKEGREVKSGGYGEDVDDDDDDEEEEEVNVEQGTEVSADGSMRNLDPPPPAYPGDSAAFFPPPIAPAHLPPPVKLASSESSEEPEPRPAASGFMSSFFGTPAGNSKRYPKSIMADAKELTTFALTALNEKDGELAVERLKQALACLGHGV